MANPPDILSVAALVGTREMTKLTTTNATAILAQPASNFVSKVNQIFIANIDGSANAEIDIFITNSSTDYYLAKTIVIPADSSLELLSQPIYVINGDELKATAGAANAIDIVVSFESITDV